jgi:hypothetical protein
LSVWQEYREKNRATGLCKALELVEKQIEWVEKQILTEQAPVKCPFMQKFQKSKTLRWTGSQVEFVELVYSLCETKIINNGDINLKEAFAALGDFFDFSVTDYYRFWGDIVKRTGDRTLLLDKLKKGVMLRLSESDNRR